MTDPLSKISTVATPQTQPVPGRTDQVRNNAGGYVFEKNIWEKLTDFVILGTNSGTYYLNEDRLTQMNADVVFQAIKEDGVRAVQLATDISCARPPRAPRNKGALFVLAAASAMGDLATRQAVKAALPLVARTTDHLSTLFGYRKQLKGKSTSQGTAPKASRSWRRALGNWFEVPELDQIAWRACKARQRKTPAGESFALRDALRIAHPKADSPARKALYGWLAGHVTDAAARELVPAIDAYLASQAVASEAEAISVVLDRKVPWEYLPSQYLASPKVWAAMVPHLGMTALIRNLARMTRIGTLGPYREVNALVTARLTDPAQIHKGRIHPMDALLALQVYRSGRSQPDFRKAPQTWMPVPEITDALEECYELSFGAVTPTGKRLVVATDCSGSMNGSVIVGGSVIGSAYHVGNYIAALIKRIEGANAQVLDFGTRVHNSKITARTSIGEIATWRSPGGGTNLSLPFGWAQTYDIKADAFVIFTDNETWAGNQHPYQALADYRQRHNPQAKVIVASLTANGYTIGEPGDAGVLNLAGMDASIHQVIAGWVR